MILKDNTVYLNRDGAEVWIAGRTHPNPDWVYSIQGDWYVRATGQRLSYSPGPRDSKGDHTQGAHVPLPESSRFTIVTEVKPYE